MSPTITVYPARRIHTMDPGRPVATAIAVMDGRVLSTGTLESMRPWLDRHEYTIDDSLRDKVILPGFIDPHTHFAMSSGYLGVPYLGPLESPGLCCSNPGLPAREDVIGKLRELDAETPAGEPIVAWGFDPAMQGGHLHRDELDAIVPERPLFVITYAPHVLYTNSAALRDRQVPDDLDVHGVGRYPDGRLDGRFTEFEAHKAVVGSSAVDLVQDAGEQGLHAMNRLATSAGITTTAELLFGLTDPDREWRLHDAVYNAADVPVRMGLISYEMTMHDNFGEQAAATLRTWHEHNSPTLFFHGVKFLADGSFPAMSLRTRFPGYLDLSNGVRNDIPWPQLHERMRPFWDADIPIHCHTNGDESIDAALDALARLQHDRPRFDHGFTFEHYCISSTDQARRVRALGAQASVNAYFVHYRSQLHADQGYGPDRSEAVARLGSLEREGVTFALHSDYALVPVPMSPLTAAWVATTRIGTDNATVLAPGERIDRYRAMRAITVDAARMLGMDRELGSLEPGKFADFAVLDADPFDVPVEQLRSIPVWGTVLGGTPHPA
ncbi:amidohydrolase [Sciscionella sediminilitoris]|uniref:amidohydrolase n=1 Tax=Sciscionella sediminilitoris TaxID=1445613 RepID=UPI0004DFC596|nr:amidohydrolase [Sciscionella sp. SE31]